MVISREVVYNRYMRLSNRDKISEHQKEIIVGSILGDGCLEFDGFYGTRLQVKQSEAYKDYVVWLYEQLENLCRSAPKARNDNGQWYFSTKHLTELTELRKLFYSDGKKRLPENIREMLMAPQSIAVWYMDDGHLDWRPKDHYAFVLNTDCFSPEDAWCLKEVLDNNFGVKSSIQNSLCRGKRYPKIYIGQEGRSEFLALIKPFVMKCFLHKLPPPIIN